MTLYLIRGVPGAGKSSLADTMAQGLDCFHYEADMYFSTFGEYKFDPAKLKDAHEWCKAKAEVQLKCGNDVIVSNTSTTEKEVANYQQLAKKYDARFVSIVVESRHQGKNLHGVPEDKIEQMKNRFSIKL